jgi:transposase
MIKHFYENLLKLTDGWHVDDLYQDNDNLEVIVSISHSTQEKYKCPKCNKAALIHDRRERTVRHLDTCDYKTLLKIKYPRVKCELCGTQAIEPPIAAISSRFTKEFEMRVVHLCYSSTVQKVARDLKLHWHVVCGIKARALGRGIKRLLQQNIGKLVTNITIDETSFQKHHNYITIITDVDRSQVIAVLPDRTAETLKKWFATQTVADFSQLRSISIDMAPPYIKALKEYFPKVIERSGGHPRPVSWGVCKGTYGKSSRRQPAVCR